MRLDKSSSLKKKCINCIIKFWYSLADLCNFSIIKTVRRGYTSYSNSITGIQIDDLVP